MKRKKILKNRIEALAEQIALHEEKMRIAKENGRLELSDYYDREIKARKKTLEESRKMFDKN